MIFMKKVKVEKLQDWLMMDEGRLQDASKALVEFYENDEYLHLEVYENDEVFFETFFGNNPMEVARSVFYGDYNFMDEYVKFNNSTGNLQSLTEREYRRLLEANSYDIAHEIISIMPNDEFFMGVELEEFLQEMEED